MAHKEYEELESVSLSDGQGGTRIVKKGDKVVLIPKLTKTWYAKWLGPGPYEIVSFGKWSWHDGPSVFVKAERCTKGLLVSDFQCVT